MRAAGMFALACMLSWSSVALAAPRTVVREFDGPNGKRVRAAVVDALEEHSVPLVSNSDAEAEAEKQGADLGTDAGRVSVGRELEVGAFVEGRVERAGAKFRVSITAYGSGGGGELAEFELSATKAGLVRSVRDGTWKALGEAIDAASAPEKTVEETPEPVIEPEPEPEAATAPAAAKDDEAADEAEDIEPTQSPLDVSVGARFGNRHFAYRDAFPGLRDYKLGLSPSVAVHAHWYPAAHFTDGFVANLGLDVRFGMLVGVKSKNSAGDEFATQSTEFGVGLRVRVPIGEHEVGVLLGYSSHSFSIESDKGTDPGVPDVAHGSVRAGADVRWAFMEPLSLQVQAAYLLSLSPGEIADDAWFPHTSGGGVQAEVGLGFAVLDGLELQAAFELQRYFFSFDPKPTDDGVVNTGRVAGGALDQYLSGRLSVLWRM